MNRFYYNGKTYVVDGIFEAPVYTVLAPANVVLLSVVEDSLVASDTPETPIDIFENKLNGKDVVSATLE